MFGCQEPLGLPSEVLAAIVVAMMDHLACSGSATATRVGAGGWAQALSSQAAPYTSKWCVRVLLVVSVLLFNVCVITHVTSMQKDC